MVELHFHILVIIILHVYWASIIGKSNMQYQYYYAMSVVELLSHKGCIVFLFFSYMYIVYLQVPIYNTNMKSQYQHAIQTCEF